jgi:hypothetical protein
MHMGKSKSKKSTVATTAAVGAVVSAAGAQVGLEELLKGIETDAAEQTGTETVIEPQGEVATAEASGTEQTTAQPEAVEKPKKKRERKAKVKTEQPAATETTGDAAPVEPKKPAEKRIFFGRNKIGRLEHKLGADLGKSLILHTADAELEGDAFEQKVAENKAAFKALSVKVQNRATNVIEFIAGKSQRLNKVSESIIRLLSAERSLTTGDKGNIYGKLSKTYSPGAARAMGNSTLGMLRALNVVAESSKGVFEPTEDSTVLALLSERMGLSFVDNAAAIEEAEAVEAEEARKRAEAIEGSMTLATPEQDAVEAEPSAEVTGDGAPTLDLDTALTDAQLQAEAAAELAFEQSAS